jgi:hypothetical protein
MKLIPKINVKRTAGLVAGGTASNYVSNNLLAGQNPMIAKAAPIVAGIFLSAQRDQLVSGLGDGMIANAGANLLSGAIGLAGTGDVLMGEDVLMGNPAGPSFTGASAEGAEMDY